MGIEQHNLPWWEELAPSPGSAEIAEALVTAIESGMLAPERRLSPIRSLAERLGVTSGTVARAYETAARWGYVEAGVGRGTFVRSVEDDGLRIDLGRNLPVPVGGRDGFLIAEALREVSERPGLSFALRGDALRPVERLAKTAGHLAPGLPEEMKVAFAPTAQAGAGAVLGALTRPGDPVVCGALTYPGIRAWSHLAGRRLVGVELDDEGMVPAHLDEVLDRTGARAVYCVPTVQMPTGATMGIERRRAIADVVDRRGATLVEDIEVLWLEPEPSAPPVSTFLRTSRAVILSETHMVVGPGLSVAVVACAPELLDPVAVAIRATVWSVSPLVLNTLGYLAERGYMEELGELRRGELRRRRDLATRALGADCAVGEAAHHLWVPMSGGWRASDLSDLLLERGIRVNPTEDFAVERSGAPQGVRVCLGGEVDPSRVREGLEELRSLLGTPARGPRAFL